MTGNPETLTNAAGVVVFEGTTSEGGGSQLIGRNEYNATTITVPTDATTKLPFVANGPDGQALLLDLSDPLSPSVIEGGVYALSVAVNAMAIGICNWSLQPELDSDAFEWFVVQGATAASPQIAASLTVYVPAGGVVRCLVTQDSGEDATVAQFIAALQRLSGPDS